MQLSATCPIKKIVITLTSLLRIFDCVNVLGSRCDVSISSHVNSLVKSAVDKFGSDTTDILVNNAGVAFDKKLLDTSEEEWDQTIDTNLKGVFLFTKAILPYMIQRNSGVIVNINSGAGKTGFSDLSSYCASKFVRGWLKVWH